MSDQPHQTMASKLSYPEFPVVCLGGSAGALESLKRFFECCPEDSGAAFIVIQHLAPAYPSLLTEILAQHTRMKVLETHEGMVVQSNSLYVIPPIGT